MKKQKLFLGCLILLIVSTSCSDDDNNESTVNFNELILGEWNYESQTLNGENLDFTDECQQEFEYQIYTDNGIYNQTEFENLTGNGCEQVESTTGIWNITDSTLNLQLDGSNNNEIEILILNENTLSIKANVDIDNDGEIDDYVINLTRRN